MRIPCKIILSSLFFLSGYFSCFIEAKSGEPEVNESFRAAQGTFLLNDEPFVIKAAELHYPRIPKDYWDHRIKMSKALGMNTICLYSFWNIHEPEEGSFDFTGQNDIREFVKLCQENDMKVILRPGPYVCAEWEMGGLPWWLLKKEDIELRSNDPYFLDRVSRFEKKLGEQLADLTIENGGPIIMIQVENEFGAYGEDKAYISNIRDMLREIYGDRILMFQCDWSSNFTLNGLDDLLWTMNFGTGADIDSQFEHLKALRPDTPLMCSEYWSGWFDKWGASHETRPADAMIDGINEMLAKDISFSLYMTHGGTNWGHWAGANSPGYAPDVTSYDYDAPIDERGLPTHKYFLLRDLLSNYTQDELPEIPDSIKVISIPVFEADEVAVLTDNLPKPVHDHKIKSMEKYNRGFGSILYSTELPALPAGSVLNVNEPHDYAQIFLNDKYVGKLDRREGETRITLPEVEEGTRLDILVEATGRINFGREIKDFKGITENVFIVINERNETTSLELTDWDVYLLPDDEAFYKNMDFIAVSESLRDERNRLPRGVYKAKFNLDETGDTFINMENWGKGLVYGNDMGIGRFWEIGPQQTLYLPGAWLKEGENEILIFDVTGPKTTKIEGVKTPVNDKVMSYEDTDGDAVRDKIINIEDMTEIFSGSFEPGNGWKKADFDDIYNSRYVGLVFKNGFDDGSLAAAEIYLDGKDGERLSRDKWKIVSVSSRDLTTGNHGADKMFDLQESTYWQNEKNASLPVIVIIDLGTTGQLSGIEYLPRMESGAPGAIKDFSVYISND